MRSLLYVSRRCGNTIGCTAHVEDIVTVARSRNSALGVTGALVAAPDHFAQMLEGTAAAIDELMLSIAGDPRHEIIDVIDLAPRFNREFAGWSLVYCGESDYVSAMLSDAVAGPGFDIADKADDILALMRMFA